MPRMMFDDPRDEMTQPPHAEPEGDESYIDDIMGKDLEGGDEDLFGKESPLESALVDAGFKVTPDQLSQIEAILAKPPAKPEAQPGKPPLGGLAKPPSAPVKPPMGGAVPAGMGSGDLPVR